MALPIFPNNFNLAMAVIAEHRVRTAHDPWSLTAWNGCDTCMWLMHVCAEYRKAEAEAGEGK